MWNKIAALTGGSTEWPIGLGLRPWYLKVTNSVRAAFECGMALPRIAHVNGCSMCRMCSCIVCRQ